LDDTVAVLQELFERHKFHHLLVVQHGELYGVISDRDLLKNLSPFVGQALSERPQDRALLHRRAHQIMTRHPVTVPSSMPLETAARVMLEHQVSCLPVRDEHGRPIGIVTVHDLLRAVVSLSTCA